MDQPIVPVLPLDLGPVPHGRCEYCGAPLYREFYFCARCATPYKRHESVLPALCLAGPSEGELVERKAPHVAGLFWTYFAVVVGASLAGYLAFGQGRPDLSILLGTAALFVTTCIFGSIHWPSLAVQFKRLGFFHWAAWAGLGALVPLLALNWAYHGLLKALGAPSSFSAEELLKVLGWDGMTLLLCVCPGVMEEIAFRGLVQHWLQIALRPWRAILLASLLFTVLHFSVISAPYLLLVGLVLGWTKWKTGSLYPSMLIHALHNFAVLALLG